jgi:hypothetical protein
MIEPHDDERRRQCKMDDLLELMRTFFAAGWVYLCVLLVVALGLLAFDRRRDQAGPAFHPAGIRSRDPRSANDTPLHGEPIAADRA